MKCEYCGKEFLQPHRSGRPRKYCSNECCYNADKDNKRIKYVWKSERADKCLMCGREIVGSRIKFCSRLCSRKYSDIQKGVIEDHGELTKVCPVCGKTFKTWKSRQIVCSTECSSKRHNRAEYHTDEQKEKRKEHDRQKYLNTHPNAKTQDEITQESLERKEREKAEREKRRIERERIQAERRAERERIKAENRAKWIEYEAEHTCCVCGETFIAHRPTAKYCSKACERKPRRKRKRYKDITIDKDITLKMLAKRDHDQCMICGLFVDWSDYIKTDTTIICGGMYPSIDHITPISLGGLHSWDNVQLAHRKCNSRKSNKYVG